MSVDIKVEFLWVVVCFDVLGKPTTNTQTRGGLDVIFESERYHKVKLNEKDDGSPLILRDLIHHISTKMIKDEKDVCVFLENGTM